eukprot:385689-Prymnesium_polylepis.2
MQDERVHPALCAARHLERRGAAEEARRLRGDPRSRKERSERRRGGGGRAAAGGGVVRVVRVAIGIERLVLR